MTALTTAKTPAQRRPARQRRRISGLHVYTLALIAWLILPIAIMILFGFNDTRSKATSGKHHLALEAYGYCWYRVGSMNAALYRQNE